MKNMTLTRLTALAAILILNALTSLEAQTLTNGGFENWGTLTGSPPTGQPTGWSVSGTPNIIQAPGLVSGSNFSALIQSGGQIYETLTPNPTNVKFDFSFVATDPGSSSSRSFSLTFGQPGANPSINLRMVRGSSAGSLTLQAFNGTSWAPVAVNTVNAFNASVYDSGTNTFTTANVYDMSIEISYGTSSSYTISYGLHEGTMTTLSNLTAFAALNTSAGLSTIGFGTGTATGFAIDNLTMTVVPEPRQTALLLWGLVFTVSMGYMGRKTKRLISAPSLH